MQPHDETLEPLLKGIRQEQLEESREVKVKLPVGHLIRLHGIKIVNGRGISETITEALGVYFKQLESEGGRVAEP